MKRNNWTLYKYAIINDEYKNTKNLLVNKTIRLNKPDEFNDPFDLNIIPRADIHTEDLISWMAEQDKKRNFTPEEKQKIERFKKNGDYTDPQLKLGLIEGALKDGIRTHGVYCFSQVEDSILMWSHYANKHQGICVQFNFTEKSPVFKLLTPVRYLYDYPHVFINEENLYDLFFTSKLFAWQYEHEVRIVKPFGGGEFLKLDNHEINSIIIGIKTSIEDISRILEWINETEVKPKLFKAIMVLREFRIIKIPINITDKTKAEDIFNLNYIDKKLRA